MFLKKKSERNLKTSYLKDYNICEDEDIKELNEYELEKFKKLSKISFASFEIENQIFNLVSMVVSGTNTYEISSEYTLFALYDAKGKLKICSEEKTNIFLFKDDIIYGEFFI